MNNNPINSPAKNNTPTAGAVCRLRPQLHKHGPSAAYGAVTSADLFFSCEENVTANGCYRGTETRC